MWATSNCVNCSRRNPRRSAKHAYHNGILTSSIAHAGISFRNKKRSIENSLDRQWILFQSLNMSSRKEDFMDTDMGDSQETNNVIWLINSRKNAKKERFPRNPWPIPPRSRIPYSNDWKSSRWRILSTMGCSCGWRSHSPFDSTRILPQSEQMVASFKLTRFSHHVIEASFWFQASIFNLATIAINSRRRTTSAYSSKHQLWEAQSSSSTWWNWQGSWWSSYISESQGGEPSFEWTVRPVACSISKESSKLAFTNSICFVTVGSFTAAGGLVLPTECVKTTPQMTRFRDAKVCNYSPQMKIDDPRKQSDYKCMNGL